MTEKKVVTTTRAHLGAAVVERTGLSSQDVSQIMSRMLELIGECLVKGQTVKLTNFGTLEVRPMAERPGRNPKTLKEHMIPSRRVVRFKAGGKLIQKIEDLGGN